jgi:thymidylate synthase
MKSAPRGYKVVEANIATLEVDPLYPIMDFKDRKFNWRYFAGELAWYLSMQNTTDGIAPFSTFWEALKMNGTINSNYGTILLGDHPSTTHEETGGGYQVNGLEWVYNSLVKDKDSRQAVAFLNCPYYQWEGNKDFVCTMYLNFWIRHDRLDMKVQMRSNDIFFGLSYDAPWFSLLHQSMFLNLKEHYPDLKLGMYYHCADNIHYYERHFELVENILNSEVEKSPKFAVKTPLFTFNENGLTLSNESMEHMKSVNELLAIEKTSGEKAKLDRWKALLEPLVNITIE